MVLLKHIKCKRCLLDFFICHSCWRGQAYCSKECRKAARREAHRKAQQKYRQTEKGKEAHRQQERRRRLQRSEKTMDDTSSTPGLDRDNVPEVLSSAMPCCRFCGKTGQIVDHFPRRGYGNRYESTHSVSIYCQGG